MTIEISLPDMEGRVGYSSALQYQDINLEIYFGAGCHISTNHIPMASFKMRKYNLIITGGESFYAALKEIIKDSGNPQEIFNACWDYVITVCPVERLTALIFQVADHQRSEGVREGRNQKVTEFQNVLELS